MKYYLGEKLKSLRESRNWTQADLAKRLNKAVSTISGYESDAHAIPLDVLSSIAMLFGISADELLGLEKSDSLSLSGLEPAQKIILEDLRREFLAPSQRGKDFSPQHRYSRSHLSLVIAATSNCNFRCVYCYERSVLRASTMSEATQEAIVKFVESEAPHLESFTVTWYGGEPLLALDIIESLSLKFIDICKKNDIAYGATIVTNGYLLNCAVVEKLNTLYVNQYQVTLDGRKEIHDCSRPLANGGGTYDVITQNLIDVKDVIPSVSLRINTGRHNVDQVHEIFEWVKDNGLSEKVFPYLGKITSTGKEDPTTSMCLNTDEFVEARIKMINGETANLQRNNFYPTPVRCYCGADSNNVFVIDSDGSLYKCWDDIGHIERAVGNINTNIEYNSTLFSYIQYSAVDDPDCSDCAVLPICMGGCPHRRVQSLPDRCSEFKDHLEEFLLITADNVIKARSKENENVQAV